MNSIVISVSRANRHLSQPRSHGRRYSFIFGLEIVTIALYSPTSSIQTDFLMHYFVSRKIKRKQNTKDLLERTQIMLKSQNVVLVTDSYKAIRNPDIF